MAGYCKVILLGNVGADCETRFTGDGTQVTNFNLAVNERVRKGEQEKVQWFRVSFFRRQAEIAAQYVHKGSQVYVLGRLSVNEFTRRDGTPGYSLEVQGDDL